MHNMQYWIYIGSQDVTDWRTHYVTHSEHTSSLKGNCSVSSTGSGAFEEVELFHTNQFRTTQGKGHPASGCRCWVL